MFSRLKLALISLSLIFIATPAMANPAVISAISTLEMTAAMSGIEASEQQENSCIALAVYHEAGNQSEEGQRAIVHVIRNRISSGRFAQTACGVVFQPGQFSFMRYGMSRLIPHAGERWDNIVRLVIAARADSDIDPTSGAMYFYNPACDHPHWRGIKGTKRIGAHVFVRA